MEGKYFITEEGNEVKVICHDEPNNMVYVETSEGEKKWVGKVDYDKWKHKYYHVPDMPEDINSQLKTENDAIPISEPKTIPLDETPENSGTVEQGISESEESTGTQKESEDTSEEKLTSLTTNGEKPKRKRVLKNKE